MEENAAVRQRAIYVEDCLIEVWAQGITGEGGSGTAD